jgi:hypothetical protein
MEEEIDASDPSASKRKSLHPKADKGSKPRKTLAPKQGSILNEEDENQNDSKQTDSDNGNQEES